MKNFDLNSMQISLEDFAKNMVTFKKENHVNGQGREQQIYTKFAFDAKRIEKKKDVKESYSTEEQKPLRKSLRNDLIAKCTQIVKLHESKSKNLDNWLQDFQIFYAKCYINHSFSWADCLTSNAKEDNQTLVQKSLDIFKTWYEKNNK